MSFTIQLCDKQNNVFTVTIQIKFFDCSCKTSTVNIYVVAWETVSLLKRTAKLFILFSAQGKLFIRLIFKPLDRFRCFLIFTMLLGVVTI